MLLISYTYAKAIILYPSGCEIGGFGSLVEELCFNGPEEEKHYFFSDRERYQICGMKDLSFWGLYSEHFLLHESTEYP